MKTLNRSQSTAWKLTSAFVVFGIVPLALLAVIFLMRYSYTVEWQTVNNLQQTCRILSVSIGDIIDSADETMAVCYDYETDEGRGLADILSNDVMEKWQKRVYVSNMLQDMMNRNSSISSIRFVTEEDQYIKFRDTEKELVRYPEVCNPILFPTVDTYRQRAITAVVNERDYCTNSNDYVFSIVRNFMNISTIEKANKVILGSIYVDINQDVISKYTEDLQLGGYGNIYVYDVDHDQFLYMSDRDHYGERVSLDNYQELIQGDAGTARFEDIQLIFNKIAGTDYYVIIEASREILRNEVSRSVTYMVITVAIVILILFCIFYLVSGHVSKPARQLQKAMKEVETGNFTAFTDIHSGDEMEYLGEGFNKMLRRLNHYIEQVYEAQICRNVAELNALKMQIQPHFLYNTLDVIRMTALDNDDPQTAELLESLSAQMRYVVNNEEGDVVPLRKEVENVNDYFAIIKVRYKGRMGLIVNIADSDMDLPVPKLLLQPLVENAVKHGLKEKEGGGHVILEVLREEDSFSIVVMDNGNGVPEEQADHIQEFMDSADVGSTDREGHVGIGMKNIHDRIRLDYGEEYGLSFTSYVGMGTIIKVRLPLPKE